MPLFALCTDYYLRYNSEHVQLVISGTGRPQENKIFKFLKVYFNKIAFIQIEFFFAEAPRVQYRGGAVASWLVHLLRVGSNPCRGHCVVFSGLTLYSQGVSLHPGV